MRLKVIISLLLLPLCLTAVSASVPDSLSSRTAEYLRSGDQLIDAGGYTSAYLFYRPWTLISDVAVSLDKHGGSDSFLPQEGTGLFGGRFGARSARLLGASTAVEGKVEYERSRKEAVLWNNTSDFLLLYPYVLADSVGGALQSEQYAFSGRASHLRGKNIYSLGAAYSALHEYRYVDPRPRNITSDLHVEAGFGRNVGEYLLASTISLRRYHQLQGIAFMNPRGANTSVFHFTGLGTSFGRFTSTSAYTDVRYRGWGYGASLLMLPHSGEGLTAAAKLDYFRSTRHLITQNEAPYTVLSVLDAGGEVSYLKPLEAFTLGGRLSLSYEQRRGDESIIPGIISSGVDEIVSLRMYYANKLGAELEGLLSFRPEWGEMQLRPKFELSSFESYRKASSRKMDMSRLSAGASLGVVRFIDKGLLGADFSASYVLHPGGDFSIPPSLTEARVCDFYSSLYENFTTDYLRLSLSLRVQRSLNALPLAVYASPSAMVDFATGSVARYYAAVKIGLIY